MAKRILGKGNREVNIYVETAYKIFNECYEKAGTVGGARNCHRKLSDEMAKKFNGDALSHTFIKNKYTVIKNLLASGRNGVEIWLYDTNLELLTRFAGIDNFEEYNAVFNPARYTRLLYTRKPFNRFELIRIPDEGLFYRGLKNWKIETRQREVFYGDRTLNVRCFTMSGDRYPLWLEIEFSNLDGLRQKLYLSTNPFPVTAFNATHPLFEYFSKLADI